MGSADLTLAKLIAIILGVFEFFACFDLWFGTASKPAADALGAGGNALLPSDLFGNKLVKVLYSAYILTLGLQRLTWSFGVYKNKSMAFSFLNYLCLLATHTAEAWLWWSCALEPHFNVKQQSALDILIDAAQGNARGGALTTILLVGVPALVLYFSIAAFPQSNKQKTA